MAKIDEIKKGHTYLQWIFSLSATATFFIYGIELGWISPTTKILQSEDSPTGYPLSDYTVSWIASSVNIAAMCAVSFYSYVADTYGRKIGLFFIAISAAISWIIRLSNTSTITLIIARLCSGFAAGGCFNIVPMYIKEISQDDIRGMLGTLPFLLINIGVLVMYLLGAYLKYFTVIKVVSVISILSIILFIKAPESPAFLMKQGKIDKANEVVALLRGLDKNDPTIEKIIENMKKEDAHFKSLPSVKITGILKEKAWRKGLILILLSFLFRVLNGVFAIVTYASAILVSTGVDFQISPELLTLTYPIVMIAASLLLAVIVERFGRKTLLIGGYLISACSLAVIAIAMIVQERGGYVPAWLPVAAIVASVALYGGGIAQLPFIIMTEMFCFQIRAKIVGVATMFTWGLTFVLVAIYMPMVNALGPYSPFIFYAIINLLGAIFTLLFLPETRAKSEEEIFELLSNEKVKDDTRIQRST